jgi:uncharacterized protein (TIGR02246 family)
MTVEEMLVAYAAAVRAKDVDAFVGLYADDVRTFDLWGVWTYDGKGALHEMVAGWFGSLPDDEVVAVRFDDVRTQTGTDVAAVSAFTTFAAVSQDGTELRSMNNRLTWVLRKDADRAWKIAHEHTSAPANDEGKVQLRR